MTFFRPTIALCVLALATGCADRDRMEDRQDTSTGAMTRSASRGDVSAVLTVEPSQVALDHNVLLSLDIEFPQHVTLKPPRLTDRLEGFVLGGSFHTTEPIDEARKALHIQAQLIPIVTNHYRIAPIIIEPQDATGHATWFTLPPIVLDLQPISSDPPSGRIDAIPDPIWVAPSARTILMTAALIGVAILIVITLVHLAKHIRRRVKIARMSARERALMELDELLTKNLVAAGKITDFYVELTMVVRRYIERRHHVRAPEQTTEEFLAAVRHDSRFTPVVVSQLRAFLESSDLIKFAARHPGPDDIDAAVQTARRYIESDDDATRETEGSNTHV